MANGQAGKAYGEEVKQRAMVLLNKGNTIPQIAARLNVSQSVIRNWARTRNSQTEPKSGYHDDKS